MGSLPLSGIESLEHFPVQRLLRRSSKQEISFCLSLSVFKTHFLIHHVIQMTVLTDAVYDLSPYFEHI